MQKALEELIKKKLIFTLNPKKQSDIMYIPISKDDIIFDRVKLIAVTLPQKDKK